MKEKLIPPKEISIPTNRMRQTFDPIKMEKLKSSLLKIGQVQPVVITREKTLIMGERRLRACLDLNRDVWVVFEDEVDELLLKEMEYAENIYRDDLTPVERILAKDGLRTLREARLKDDVSTRQLADEIGESKSQVAEDLKLALFIKAAPTMFSICKTRTEVRRVVKQLERRVQWKNLEEAAEKLEKKENLSLSAYRTSEPRELTSPEPVITQQTYVRAKIAIFSKLLQVADAFKELDKLGEAVYQGKHPGVNLMLLDPPWGIEHQEKQDDAQEGEGFDDAEDKFKKEFPKLVKLCYRAMTKDSHLYCFFSIIHHQFVYDSLEAAKFIVNRRPIIVCKEGRSSTRSGNFWPGAGYEPLAFVRKGGRELVKRGAPDWFPCKWPTITEKKGHPTAKPPLLYVELLRRSAYPGDIVCDPMFGTAPAFVACEMVPELKLEWFGWEKAKGNRAKAIVNLTELLIEGGLEDE